MFIPSFYHFCHILLVTQTNPGSVWEWTTWGCEHQEMGHWGPSWRLVSTVDPVAADGLIHKLWLVQMSEQLWTVKLDPAGTGQESSFFLNHDAFESSPDTAFWCFVYTPLHHHGSVRRTHLRWPANGGLQMFTSQTELASWAWASFSGHAHSL